MSKRQYSISDNCIITDDGYTISAEITNDKVRSIIGIVRPRNTPITDQLKAKYSDDGKYFYLKDFTDSRGFWLGVKKWDSREDMEAQQLDTMFGKPGVAITPIGGATYYREMLPFCFWKVSASADNGNGAIASSDDAAKDYLALFEQSSADLTKRFNDAISSTGKTLDWIMQRINPWVDPDPVAGPVALVD